MIDLKIKNLAGIISAGLIRHRRFFLILIVAASAIGLVGGVFYILARGQADQIPRAVLLDSDRFTRAGRYQDAAIYLQQAMAVYGRQPTLLLRLGCVESMLADSAITLEAKMQRFSTARSLLNEAEALDPDEVLIPWNRALLAFRAAAAYREAGLLEQAQARQAEFMALARAVSQRRDWQPDLQLHLGQLAELRGDWSTAAQHYVAEINNMPNHPAAFHSLLTLRRQHAATQSVLPDWYPRVVGITLLVLLGLGLTHRSQMENRMEGQRYYGSQHQTS